MSEAELLGASGRSRRIALPVDHAAAGAANGCRARHVAGKPDAVEARRAICATTPQNIRAVEALAESARTHPRRAGSDGRVLNARSAARSNGWRASSIYPPEPTTCDGSKNGWRAATREDEMHRRCARHAAPPAPAQARRTAPLARHVKKRSSKNPPAAPSEYFAMIIARKRKPASKRLSTCGCAWAANPTAANYNGCARGRGHVWLARHARPRLAG